MRRRLFGAPERLRQKNTTMPEVASEGLTAPILQTHDVTTSLDQMSRLALHVCEIHTTSGALTRAQQRSAISLATIFNTLYPHLTEATKGK